MTVMLLLVYIYLLLRPYYFFASGGLQISDIFLILAFALFVLINSRSSELYKIKVESMKENRLFFFFTVLVFCINIIYFISYPDSRFIMSTLYFIFNLFVIYIFTFCMKKSLKFTDNAFKIFVFNLIIQFLLYVLKIGRYWDSSRYMGTFNDPNQFGYYILLTYSFVYLLNRCKNIKGKCDGLFMLISFFISLFLIIQSSSTGMILGFSTFIILAFIDNLKKPINFLKNNKNKIALTLMFCVPILVFICVLNPSFFANTVNKVGSSDIFNRVVEKINRAENTSNNTEEISIWEDRALDYIILYPKYILFGSGEGGKDRFPMVHHFTEIHSTFPALLFYYGIFPMIILLIWIQRKLKGIDAKCYIIYFALIAESFTLANQRQALFWTIFCLATLLKEKKNEKVPDNMLDGTTS